LVGMVTSCKKQDYQQDTQIKVILPTENSFYSLPDTIHAEIFISVDKQPDYIRICVCDAMLTPVFTPVYFYPESLQTNLVFDYILENVDVANQGQLYFQVTVATETVTNSFTKIQFESQPLRYTGFYLFTRPTVNETNLKFVGTDLNIKLIASIGGNYETSAISSVHGMVYFLAKTPDRLYANQYGEEPFSWINLPTGDFPEFTSLCADGNKVYSGYGNGKIGEFADVSGQQLVSTPVMADSVPEKLIVTENYIVGDFMIKNKPSRSLSVFYKSTGARFQRAVHYTEVVDFYTEKKEKELLVFGNEDGKAVASQYFFEGNYFSNALVIADEIVAATCRVGELVFLYNTSKAVFSIDLKTLIKKELVALNDEIISIKFDETEQVVFIATANYVYFYAYPSMLMLDSFYSTEPIKGIELRYAY
jgi:hypothetical protein